MTLSILKSHSLIASVFLPMLFTSAVAAQATEIGTYAKAGFACCSSGSPETGKGPESGTFSSAAATYSGTSFGLPSTSVAAAHSNIATGSLGVLAGSSGYGEAVASATFRERITFTVDDVDPTAITPIDIIVYWHGLVTSTSGRSFSQFIFVLGDDMISFTASSQNGSATAYQTYVGENWRSQSIQGENSPSQYVYLGYGIPGQTYNLDVYLNLVAESHFDASANLLGTTLLNFKLPSNVTYKSDSGVFLSEAPTISAVPESATWGMMLAGFGMIGAAMRTRRRSAKVTFA